MVELARGRTAVLVGCLVLLVAAAGCLGDGEPAGPGNATTLAAPDADAPTGNGTGDAGEDGSGGVGASGWSVGDHWTFDSERFGSFQLVVTGGNGSHWTVDTTSANLSLYDAREELPVVGPIRGADLAGQANGTPVRFFDWPLEPGKTWTTPWGDAERQVTVEQVANGTAHLVAREDGQPAARYTYDADAAAFGSFALLDDEGEATFDMTLTDHGTGFAGEAVRWRLTRVLHLAATYSQVDERPSGTYDVPGWADELYAELTLTCPAGSGFNFGSAPAGPLVIARTQTDDGYEEKHVCPADVDKGIVATEGPESGTWGYGLETASPAGETSYELSLFARALETVEVQPP